CLHLNAVAPACAVSFTLRKRAAANPVTWNYNALRVNGDVCVLRRKSTSKCINTTNLIWHLKIRGAFKK
uniref:Uncharacterized protein n=1 Tax=Poecilia mexicana TaxID=48701 RepID=A0A3B3YME0_9TELE